MARKTKNVPTPENAPRSTQSQGSAVSPHRQLEQSVVQVADLIEVLDEKARAAAEVLAPRLERHLTGVSIMDECMRRISLNSPDADLPELDTTDFDIYLNELKDAGDTAEFERGETRDKFLALMSDIDMQNTNNTISLRAARDSLRLGPATSAAPPVDAYALPEAEAWDGEVNVEEGGSDDD